MAAQRDRRAPRRTEDLALLTGRGGFAADHAWPGQLHAAFLRSPHAHARLLAIDADAARALPGVVAVLAGADLAALAPLPWVAAMKQADGSPMQVPPRHALARGSVRHVGEAVALVVAESAAAALDAAEAIAVTYDPLPVLVDPGAPADPAAPDLWPGLVERNILGRYAAGDAAAVAAAMAAAPHRVRLRLSNNRLVPAPMEPRAALAVPGDGRITLHCATQAPHILREQLAAVLRLDKAAVRIVVGDIGGGFGQRMFLAPELAALAAAARHLGRPIRWVGTRAEAFLADTHGRDQHADAELGLDAAGRFLALRLDVTANAGAYLAHYGAIVPTRAGTRILTGCYDIPAACVAVRLVLTNTAPVDAYRGAGRPETLFTLERLVDVAAAELGLDRVAIRRRNLVPPQAMPYRTALGEIYDSGDFPGMLDAALAASDWAGFDARRAAAARSGCRLGRGLSCTIESTGMANLAETVALEATADGIVLRVGTQGMGQGLATSYAQLVGDALGLAPEAITVVMGDTDQVPRSVGSGGSRSLYVGGTAVRDGAVALLAAARPLAAAALEAAAADLHYAGGRFSIAGTDRGIALTALAAGQDGGRIGVVQRSEVAGISWPNGCHVAEVEIEQATGRARVTRVTAVDDAGRVVNAMIVHGQVQGGLAQGIGQALIERTHYDAAGQLTTASFLDYALPRADDLPAMTVLLDERAPCRSNPLGAKGTGEAGAIGVPPAVVAAVVDALGDPAIRHLDMPITAEALWLRMRAQQDREDTR
jgi:carbon-monoxide dehydrogenase large subunit